jgi:chromate reductase, NAD(P)H dehydrogenase (quinone)
VLALNLPSGPPGAKPPRHSTGRRRHDHADRLKNAIDWLSRPPKDIGRVFGGRPAALLGATPGRGGTRLAQQAWLPVFRVLGVRPYFGKSLYVAGAGDLFDGQGVLTDATTRRLLTELVQGFVAFVGASRS